MKAITGMYVFSAIVIVSLANSQPTADVNVDLKRLLQPASTIRTGVVDRVGRIDYVAQTGEYRITWRGNDGRLLQTTYTPEWRAKVTLIASVERLQDSTWRYTYTIHNLPRSPHNIVAIYVTTDDAEPVRTLAQKGWRFTGVPQTHKGQAFSFCVDPASEPYAPLAAGQQVCFQLISKHPPAVGTCFVSSDAPLIRVPEEMPSVLADRLPLGLDGGLRGYTLSPSRRLSAESFRTHWRAAIDAGWVGDKQLASRLTMYVERTVAALQSGHRLRAQNALATIQQLALEYNEKLEPEAKVLLLQSLPYLVHRAGSTH
ncbi:MAG: hypothetical protein KatS3mg023_1946 [Armatimonadota bacterium]|nr:MAG: hypothetical protein KatS3mg023_1946 [Armatimonadota bacterium]